MTLKTTLTLAAMVSLAAASSALAQAGQAPPMTAQRSAYPDLLTGEAIYKGVCQGCHMPDAKGASGAGTYPALANNPKLGAPAYPIMVVARGQKAMPEFGSSLTDAQIAGVVTYIRSTFNGFKDVVPASAVGPMRPTK